MKITVLMENTTTRDDLHAQHGLSLFIETQNHKVLLDTGASDLTWENAATLGIDVSKADTLVLSHGHYDHSGGLYTIGKANPDMKIYMQKTAIGQFYHGEHYIGIDPRIKDLPNVILLDNSKDEPFAIDDELSIFSNITGRKLWPKGNLLLTERVNALSDTGSADSNVSSDTEPAANFTSRVDSFNHEQCLAVYSDNEYTLFSGCAHNGILNIMEKFEDVYHCQPRRVFSGFHMMKDGEYTEEEIENIKETATELLKYDTIFYTGHCTSQPGVDILKEIMGDRLIQIHTGDSF